MKSFKDSSLRSTFFCVLSNSNLSSSDIHRFFIIHSSLNVLVKFSFDINSEKCRKGIFLTSCWKKYFSPSIGSKNCVLIIIFLFLSIILLSNYIKNIDRLFVLKFIQKFYFFCLYIFLLLRLIFF